MTSQALTQLLLTWTAPEAAFQGYLLEFSVDGGPFQQVGSELIPATWEGVVLTFPNEIPELQRLGFRLTAIRAGQPSGTGALASFIEPIRSPTLVNAGPGTDGIFLQLGGSSRVADRYHVERTDSQLVIDLPLLLYNYVFWSDQNVLEDVEYAYKVSLSDGVHSSNPVTSQTVVVTILPPRDLAARSTDAGHIELTWTNRSARATDYFLRRWPGTGDPGPLNVVDLAHASPGAGQYDDSVPVPGVYSYRFELSAPSGEQALSRIVPSVTAPSGALKMSGIVISSPNPSALLDADGGTFSATSAYGLGWTLIAPSGATFQTEPGVGFGTTGYVLDAHGGVHALLTENVDAGPQYTLTHVWFDGTRWMSEPAGTATPYYTYPNIELAISPSGAMQIAWVAAPTLDGFVIAEQQADGGLLVTQPETGQSGSIWTTPQLVMGQPRPHLLFSAVLFADNTNQVIDIAPDAFGTWSATGFPVPSPELVRNFAVVPEADGGFAVACACSRDDAGAIGLGLIRRNVSGWDPPEPVGAIGLDERVIGASRGGSIALATQWSLYTRDEGAAWGRTDLPPVRYDGEYPSQVGFLEDAGVFVLSPIDYPFVAFFVEEP